MIDASTLPLLLVALYIVCGGLLMFWLFLYIKGRPPEAEGSHTFRASRLSAGNRLLPSHVAITPERVVRYTPQWVGRHERAIPVGDVASVRIEAKRLFSDVHIEAATGGGAIVCTGYTKQDALRMKALIERHQSEQDAHPEQPTRASRA